LALNPSTAVETVSDAMEEIDYLLILSADLGFADSPFLPGTLSKVQSASAMRSERRLDFAIQVEGSIRLEQVEVLCQAGADILVAGSDIFQEDPRSRLAEMMRQAAMARQVSRV
jgi:ribulose-phosphate 3-epimerase